MWNAAVTNQHSSSLGFLQHLISDTVPIACVGLNIGGGHPLQRTSKEKRVEEIKYSISTQNTLQWVNGSWNCWHCQLPWEWISLFLPSLQYIKNIPKLGVYEHFLRANLLHYTIRESCSRFHSSVCALKLSVKFFCLRRKVLFYDGKARRQSASHQTHFNPTTCLAFLWSSFFFLVQGIERTKQFAPS